MLLKGGAMGIKWMSLLFGNAIAFSKDRLKRKPNDNCYWI